ncbi:aspartyl protease family protein [Kordiimonas aquimaris]|uniref:aspartyl protease family protein n=1 Tax=Kordiimonas aquimaris TaxID=707591 RepID=UPI0021CF2D66|nr:aspartyl protease family protein [Kordiimonas aquimaris]
MRLPFFVALLSLCTATPLVAFQDLDGDDGYIILPDRYDRPTAGTVVNGVGPLPFIIDTGASKSVIYRSLTSVIDLQALPNQSKRIITATGYKRVLVYPVTDFYVLGRTLNVQETVALPDIIGSQAKGLIGVDMLAGLTLTMDMGQGLARLQNPDETRFDDSWTMIQGRPVAYGSLALEVNIGGVDVPVIVDTGASDTVINTAGSDALTLAATGVRRQSIRASISNGGVMDFVALVVPSFKVGDYERTNMRLVVSDIPVFTTLGARSVPAIILGMDLLGEQPFAIDFKNWRLYLGTQEADTAIASE